MARGVPAFYEGSHAAGGGSADALMAAILACLAAYQSNGEQAWEWADEIDGNLATYKAVYHSVGDRSLGIGANKGDTDIWLYVYRSGTSMYFEIAQDYSPTDGTWAIGAYHPALGASWINVPDTTALHWWCVINEYEVQFVASVGYYTSTAFGMPVRPYSTHMDGVGRITSQSGTGNGVSIGVDRDLTATLRAGQKVWLINQTPDSTSLQSVSIDIVDIVSVGASTVVVDGVTNSYAVGSLIGYDPAALYVRTNGLNNNYFVSKLDGTWTSKNGQVAGMVNVLASLSYEPDIDPGPDGLYHCYPLWMKMGTTPAICRGRVEYVQMVGLGSQANEDILRIDFDDDNRWQLFTTLPASLITSWAAAYGPGASVTPGTTHEARLADAVPVVREDGGGTALTIGVVSTSPTTWRVTFSVPVLDNAALRSASNYSFSPDLTVVGIIPESTTNPNYVDIETSEQLDGQSYTLTIHLVESA